MFVIGSAQVVNILVSVIRMKVVAVLLGPSGVGLLSIFVNLQALVKQGASLGMGSSGVREIASSRSEEASLGRVRRVLFAALLLQGVLAMLGVWILRAPLAVLLFDDAGLAPQVGLVGVAVLLAMLGTAQTALLQGMRKISELARVTVIGTLVGTLAGLLAVWWQGERGLIWLVIVQPLALVVIALAYTRSLPRPPDAQLQLREIWQGWKPMVVLGFAFMLGGLASSATLLLVRGRISQELGLDAAGHFAAAWGISTTYIGFLLGAMGADYYPRLTEIINDKSAAIRLMNDQAQLGLAIGGPVLLLLIGLAPWLITLMYSGEFGPAGTMLQWQTVGNVFKLASWALGYSVAASALGKTFLAVQLNFNIVFLLLLWPSLSTFGIQVAGPAFAIAHVVHFALLNFLVRRIHGFRWQGLSLGLLALHSILAVALLAAAFTAPLMAAIASPIVAFATGLFGLRVVLIKVGPEGRLASKLARIYAAIGWPIKEAS